MSRSALIRLDNFSWNLCKMGFTLSFEQLCKTVFVILTIFIPFSLSSFVVTILKGYLYSLKSSHLQTSCLRKTFCSWQMWTKSQSIIFKMASWSWFEFGTKYFLRCKVAKRSKSFVREFEKSNGDVIHDSFEIEKQFYDHFKCILETPDPLPSVATLRLLINKICNWPAISSQSIFSSLICVMLYKYSFNHNMFSKILSFEIIINFCCCLFAIRLLPSLYNLIWSETAIKISKVMPWWCPIYYIKPLKSTHKYTLH